jgi:hypothetical protein
MTNVDPYLSAAVSVFTAVAMTFQAWLLCRAYRYQNDTERLRIMTDERHRAGSPQPNHTAPEQERPTGDPNTSGEVQRF